MADYYRDIGEEWLQQLRFEAEDSIERNYNKGTLLWKTQFNGSINVCNMTLQHIINTKDFLIAKKNKTDDEHGFIKIFKLELKKRKNGRN